jgi:3-hydroxyisobutyrate dehydrogenase-like beta-hydroxyacid dehydrogenase
LDNFGQVWAEDITEMMLDGKPYYPSKIPEKDLTLVMELQKKQKLPTNFISALKEVYRSLEE